MHTNLKTEYVAMSVLALYLSAPILQAAPTNNIKSDNIKSPYRLNVKPVELPQVTNQPATIDPTNLPQMYQLEYKYRSQKNPVKTKPPPQALTVRYIEPKPTQNNLETQPYSNEIALAAQAASLDPSLVHAVIYVESRYQHKAVSPKGAVGLMQVLPDTAARYGLKHAVYLPKENIKAGTLYLRDLMVMFPNRLDLVLAAYNAGENAVKKHARQIPPYPETKHYVKAVMAKYASNTGNTESGVYAGNDKNETDNIAKAAPDNKGAAAVMPVRTKYMPGTDLAISNEAFTFSADTNKADTSMNTNTQTNTDTSINTGKADNQINAETKTF